MVLWLSTWGTLEVLCRKCKSVCIKCCAANAKRLRVIFFLILEPVRSFTFLVLGSLLEKKKQVLQGFFKCLLDN